MVIRGSLNSGSCCSSSSLFVNSSSERLQNEDLLQCTVSELGSLTSRAYSCHPVLFQALTALLSDDSKFGFIVIDGSGALFGTLQGNTREVLHKFTVDLPKKHGNVLVCL